MRLFLAVAETENMTEAARRLNMSQPPVSQCIAELEKYYAVRLFDRLGRGIRITSAGRELQSIAAHILYLTDEAERHLGELRQGGTLRVGCSVTVGTVLLPGWVKEFRAEGGTEVFTAVANTSDIVARLRRAELDLGIIEGDCGDSDLYREPIMEDELVLTVPPGHPFALKPQIGCADLDGQRFLVREKGSGTREAFEAAMTAKSIRWELAGEVNNTEALFGLVSAGAGMGFLPRRQVQEPVRRGLVRTVETPELHLIRRFQIIYHKNKFITPSMDRFLQKIRLHKDL